MREETGVRGEIVCELGIDTYALPQEEVRALYFLMRFVAEAGADEERALRWVAAEEAAAEIVFDGMRSLVEQAVHRLDTLA